MPARKILQKSIRKDHVRTIVRNVAKTLKSKGHQKRMTTTNAILPPGGLRRRVIKKVFGGWICDFHGQGRVLTKRLAKDVCKGLRKKFELGPPTNDDGSEVSRMHQLLKAARKRKVSKPVKPSAMSTVDALETIPMFEEDVPIMEEDWDSIHVGELHLKSC